MNKFEKTIDDDKTKKDSVLKILELLDGESYYDSLEILDIAKYFLKMNTFVDYNLARELINAVGKEL